MRHRIAYQANFSTASLRLRTVRLVISFQSIFSLSPNAHNLETVCEPCWRNENVR
jgi:hypothetical protein